MHDYGYADLGSQFPAYCEGFCGVSGVAGLGPAATILVTLAHDTKLVPAMPRTNPTIFARAGKNWSNSCIERATGLVASAEGPATLARDGTVRSPAAISDYLRPSWLMGEAPNVVEAPPELCLNAATKGQRMRPVIVPPLTVTCERCGNAQDIPLSRLVDCEEVDCAQRWGGVMRVPPATVAAVQRRFTREVFDLSRWEPRKVGLAGKRRRPRSA